MGLMWNEGGAGEVGEDGNEVEYQKCIWKCCERTSLSSH